MTGILALVVLLGPLSTLAAYDGPPALLWSKELPDWIHEVQHIIPAQGGGFIAATVPSTRHKPIVRLDESGDVLWEAGDCGIGFAYWVEQLDDGSIVATGWGTDPEQTMSGLWLSKVTSSGTPVWFRIYYISTGYERLSVEGRCIAVLPDGGFAITGHVRNYDSWLLRTDSLGDTLWTRVWDSGTWERARRVVYLDNGLTVFLSAQTPHLLRYSMDGDLLWERSYPGLQGGPDFPGSMCLSGSGDGYTFVMSSQWNNTIWGTDRGGDILWQDEIVHYSENIAQSLERTMDGGYIFSGADGHYHSQWNGISYSVSPRVDWEEPWNGWLVKLDSLGRSEWHVSHSMGSRDVYFNHAIQLSHGGYIVAGQIWDEVHSDWNAYLLRYAPETGIENEESFSGQLLLTPSANPFISSVTITCEGESLPVQLMVYDITGRLIRSLSDRQGSSFIWDGHDGMGEEAPTGTYLIRGAAGGRIASVRVVRL